MIPEYISVRLRLLRLSVIYTWQQESAYFANNWASLASTLLYTLTYIVFINVVFSNVKFLAGYDRQQMLFFSLMGQLQFYAINSWSTDNINNLVDDVNKGNLDLLLIRPLPALFYVSFRAVDFIGFLRDGLVPLVVLASIIDWRSLHLTLPHVAAAALIFFCGQIGCHVVQLLLALPVFWNGEAEQFFGMWYSLSDVDIPYEGLSKGLKVTMTVLIPVLLGTSVAASAALGKGSSRELLAIALAVAAVALMVRVSAWRFALKNYTSASS
jgi:ABC-type uncharacterized transport system permease subunit